MVILWKVTCLAFLKKESGLQMSYAENTSEESMRFDNQSEDPKILLSIQG
jgi:hypothetical protein